MTSGVIVSTGTWRPVVPPEFRRQVFASVHGLAHAGTRATCRLINSRFVWPGLAADVKEWCRECTNCNRAKVTQQETTTVQKILVPEERFSHVHVDLVGPLPPSSGGFTHLLTIVDRSTRWPEACLLKGTATEDVLEAFITTWVARYGVPAQITSDRGPQFTSARWTSWCKEKGILHTPTTAFHPQANGMVERLHRQIKDAVRAREGSRAWADHLPWVLLGLRAPLRTRVACLLVKQRWA
jgi:transposase InsO family protein